MTNRPLASLIARVVLTGLCVWVTVQILGGILTTWTELLLLAAIVVPIWLATGRGLAVVRRRVTRVRASGE